ncbi:MAG: hypothetical protein R6U44_00880, partial [Archaeoglobaceae archaeon]
MVLVKEAGGTDGLTVTFEAGDHWAAKEVVVDITESQTNMIMIETAKHLDSDGKIHCVLTPASGQDLDTNHAAE